MTMTMPRLTQTSQKELNHDKAYGLFNLFTLGAFATFTVILIVGAAYTLSNNPPPVIFQILSVSILGIMVLGAIISIIIATTLDMGDAPEVKARQQWVRDRYGINLTNTQVENLFLLNTGGSGKQPTTMTGFIRYGATIIPGYKYTIEVILTDNTSNLGPGVHLIEADPDGMKELPHR